ncbi:MAG: sulfur oxidation c-type cytochrome SoxX [Candidatus Binatia bacterium]
MNSLKWLRSRARQQAATGRSLTVVALRLIASCRQRRIRVATLTSVVICGVWYGLACSDERSVTDHIVGDSIPTPLTVQSGDAEHGRRIVRDRERGDCVVCHAMPLPDRQFHGTVGPPLDGIGSRYSVGELRLRLVDPKRINPQTVMPAYYKIEGLHQVAENYRGKPILTAQEIEDVVAYLLTLK